LGRAMALAISVAIDPLSLTRTPPADGEGRPTAARTDPSDAAPAASAERASEAAPVSSPPPPERPVTVAPRDRVEAPLARPSTDAGPALRGGLGAIVAVGAAPSPDVGVTAHLGVRWRNLAASAEGRFDAGATRDAPSKGTVECALRVLSIVPCLHRSIAF